MGVLEAESINHTSVPVNDLERARTFYVEMLGMRELTEEGRGSGGQDPTAGMLGVLRPGLCRLECGGVEVTLFQRPSPVDPGRWRDNGFFHYLYRMSWDRLSRLVNDLDALRQSGYDIPCEPVYRPFGLTASTAQSMSLYMVDPEGNLLELVGRPMGSPWRTPGPGAP